MSRILGRLAIGACLVALATPAPARAQLGGLIKKAKKSVEQHQQDPNARPSSAFGPELTEQTITGVLRGLAAQNRLLDQRDSLARQRDALLTARGALVENHDAEIDAYQTGTEKNRDCRAGVLERESEAMQAKMAIASQQLMSDPAKLAKFQKDMMAVQTKAAQLMQKGDTTGAVELQIAFARQIAGVAGTPKADSAKADQECGPAPTKPGWMVQGDADAARADTLAARMRDLETQANDAAIRESGLPAAQFAQARERIVNWFRGGRDNNHLQQFGKAELNLFHEHQAQIEKLERVL